MALELSTPPADSVPALDNPDNLYLASMALNRALGSGEDMEKLSVSEWKSYYDAQAAIWKRLYDRVSNGEFPAWAVSAAGTQQAGYAQQAYAMQRSMDRNRAAL